MPSIFLVGFMGSGKSTVAKELAMMMKLSFVDLDSLIVEREKRSIPELFDERGEAGFRQAETAALEAIVHRDRLVVALGGGTFCCAENRSLIDRADGVSVYLDVPWLVIKNRLPQNDPGRPIFSSYADAKKLFAIRRPAYERADFRFELEGNEAPEYISSMIRSRLSEVPCVI